MRDKIFTPLTVESAVDARWGITTYPTSTALFFLQMQFTWSIIFLKGKFHWISHLFCLRSGGNIFRSLCYVKVCKYFPVSVLLLFLTNAFTQSLFPRDAVAKILYSLLFHWLTERINAQVYPRQHALSISILDIYGFEVIVSFLSCIRPPPHRMNADGASHPVSHSILSHNRETAG